MSAARRALLAVALVAAAYAGCGLLPYTNAAYDVSQTMYSGLVASGRTGNHLFLPQRRLSDLGDRVEELAAEIGAPLAGRADQERAAFLQDRRRQSLEAVRVAVAGLCAAGHTVALTFRVAGEPPRRAGDACRDPFLAPRAWVPFRLHGLDEGPR